MKGQVPNPEQIPTPGARIDRHADLPFLLAWGVSLGISFFVFKCSVSRFLPSKI